MCHPMFESLGAIQLGAKDQGIHAGFVDQVHTTIWNVQTRRFAIHFQTRYFGGFD